MKNKNKVGRHTFPNFKTYSKLHYSDRWHCLKDRDVVNMPHHLISSAGEIRIQFILKEKKIISENLKQMKI